MPATPLDPHNYDLNDFKRGATLNLHQKLRYRLVRDLIQSLPKAGNCLDYGCGLGDVAFQISDMFDSIVGVDPTPQRVAWANREFAPLEFHVCDDTLDVLGDRHFDTVLSSVVINWADDPVQYLANAHKVLVPGGNLVIIVRNADAIRNFIRKLLGKPPVSFRDYKEIYLESMNRMLIDAGFEIIHTDCFYESISECLGSVNSITMEIIRAPMRLLRLPGHSSYYGIVARKPG